MSRRYRMATEQELLAWAQEGDERAFTLLIEPHRDVLFSVCNRICPTPADAQDALQNALLAAWQHIGRFQGRSKLSTWLYRIAHNAALAQVRRKVAVPASDLIAEGPAVAGRSSSIDDVQTVRWALAKIPPDFRAALVLREYHDLTYAEIAEIQGIKVETVKTRIARGRQAVAALIEQSQAN
jgi:RNA polymerase sigma factor (sigma-70 family)